MTAFSRENIERYREQNPHFTLAARGYGACEVEWTVESELLPSHDGLEAEIWHSMGKSRMPCGVSGCGVSGLGTCFALANHVGHRLLTALESQAAKQSGKFL